MSIRFNWKYVLRLAYKIMCQYPLTLFMLFPSSSLFPPSTKSLFYFYVVWHSLVSLSLDPHYLFLFFHMVLFLLFMTLAHTQKLSSSVYERKYGTCLSV